MYDSRRSLYQGELMGHENKGLDKGEYRSKINKSKKIYLLMIQIEILQEKINLIPIKTHIYVI